MPTAAEQQFLEYLTSAQEQVGRIKQLTDFQSSQITALQEAVEAEQDVTPILERLVESAQILNSQVSSTVGSINTPPVIIGLTASVIPADQYINLTSTNEE